MKDETPTLAELGISKRQSVQWRTAARLSDYEFLHTTAPRINRADWSKLTEDEKNAELDDILGPSENATRREETQPASAQGSEKAAEGSSRPEIGLTGETESEINARESREQERVARRKEAEKRATADEQRENFTLSGSDRDADEAAAHGQQSFLNEPEYTYDDERATSNLPSREERAGRVVQQADEHGAGNGELPSLDFTQGQIDLFTPEGTQPERRAIKARLGRRYESVRTGSIRSGLTHIHTPEDAAHVAAPIRKNSQENLIAMVTDGNGKILAVINHSLGDTTSTTVNPALLEGAIHAVPGAKQVWIAHNHPGGVAVQSGADEMVSQGLRSNLKNTGIKYRGSIVVAPGGRASFISPENEGSVPIEIRPAARRHELGVIGKRLRSFGKVNSIGTPQDLIKAMDAIPEAEGVMLLDAQLTPVAFLPMSAAEMAQLRTGDSASGAGAILQAVHESNAESIAAKVEGGHVKQAQNVMNFGRLHRMRPIDIIVGGKSAKAQGLMKDTGAFFSRSGTPTRLADFWERYAQKIGAFRYKRTDAKDAAGIARDYRAAAQGFTLRGAYSMVDDGTGGIERVPRLEILAKNSNGDEDTFASTFPQPDVPDAIFIRINDRVTFARNRNGALAYQMAMTWAVNNGFRVFPDTELIPVNRLRRTEATVSMMLKYGMRAAEIYPHREQFVGLLSDADYARLLNNKGEESEADVPADIRRKLDDLKNRYWHDPAATSDDAIKRERFYTNLENLLVASQKLAERRVHEINQIKFTADGFLENSQTGERVPLAAVGRGESGDERGLGALEKLGVPSSMYQRGVGEATFRRAVVTRSILHSEIPGRTASERAESRGEQLPNATRRPDILEGRLAGPVDDRAAQTALDSLGPETLYRKSPAQPGLSRSGLPVSRIQAIVDAVAKAWRNAPAIKVVSTPADIPYGAVYSNTEGAYIAGDGIYLVASNLHTPQRVLGVLAHEAVGHHGFEQVFGMSFEQLADEVKRMEDAGSRIVRRAARQVDRSRPGLNREKRAREIVAVIAEHGEHISLFMRLKTALRNFLRSLGINLKLDDSDIAAMLREAERHLRGGRNAATANAQPAFSQQAPVFYSQMREAIARSMGAQEPVAALKQKIEAWAKKGLFKPEELKWSGLMDWLDMQGPKVSREAVLNFLDNNGVQVQETTLANSLQAPEHFDVRHQAGLFEIFYDGAHGKIPKVEGNSLIDAIAKMQGRLERAGHLVQDNGEAERANHLFSASESLNAYLERAEGAGNVPENGTKFDKYQLPGGENYHELLLTLPSTTKRSESENRFRVRVYTSDGLSSVQHATQPQIDAMRRNGRRLDVLGPVTTYSSNDFISPHFNEPNILAHVRFNDRTDADGNKVLFIEELQSDWGQRGKKEGFVGAIPSAPFVGKTETWVSLALKRMIHWAAENGYAKVAWTNGEQQAARYDLSKHISEVHYSGTNLKAYDHDGNAVISETGVTPERLPDYIGKEAAEKLLAQPRHGTLQSLAAQDLKVGGEGMKAFYDRIMPNIANDVLKKLDGGRVGEVDVTGLGKQPGFQITPKLMESALAGMPLFSRSSATREAYDKRIDELFDGAKPNREGVRMLDAGDALALAGYGNLPVVLNESHAVGDGAYNHPLTREAWKRMPEWIDNPAAMFERARDGRITIIGPEKINGHAVVIGLEPRAEPPHRSGGEPRHLVLTAFEKDRGMLALRQLVEDGHMKPIYIDETKGPTFYAGSGVQFPGRAAELRASNRNIMTNRNLVKYRAEHDSVTGKPLLSRAGTEAQRTSTETPGITTELGVSPALEKAWSKFGDKIPKMPLRRYMPAGRALREWPLISICHRPI